MGKAFIAALLLLSTPAHAVNCYPVAEMIDRLGAIGQIRWEGGMRSSGHVVVVFVNPETRDWTIVETRRNKEFLCITSAGQGWERKRSATAEKSL